jgi:hypothetical protein
MESPILARLTGLKNKSKATFEIKQWGIQSWFSGTNTPRTMKLGITRCKKIEVTWSTLHG